MTTWTPSPAAERKALNTLPWKKKDFERAVGAPGYFGEKGFTTVERLWIRPTLEPNGIWGGYQGEGAKTVIPSKAYAKFSTRLVPNQNPEENRQARGAAHSQAAAQDGHCKFETLSSGKPWVAPITTRFSMLPRRRCRRASAKKPCSSAKAAPSPSSRKCTTPSKCRAS